MPRLAVNVDHIATLREARGGREPDPVYGAVLAELAGAEGIIVHLREDRRHIKERDVELLRAVIKTKLNLEMSIAEDIVAFALNIKPNIATLVPERRQERTTESGLDLINNKEKIKEVIKKLKDNGILVSLFIDPKQEQIEIAKELNTDMIELHTGEYANAKNLKEKEEELQKLKICASFGRDKLGLVVTAGHGLNYHNVTSVAQIPQIEELNIGHSIISYAVLVGIEEAVRRMLKLIHESKGYLPTSHR